MALAYNPAPSDAELLAAMKFGQEARKYEDFIRGHRFPIGDKPWDGGVIFTPWLSVASAAREAAQKYRPFTLAEARRIAEKSRNSLMLVGSVYHTQRGFWRDLHVVILQDEKIHQPAEVKADVALSGIRCDQYGSCEYPAGFSVTFRRTFSPWKDATGIITWSGEERRFPLPLSKIR